MDSLQDLATPNKIEHEITLSSLPPTPSKTSTAFTIDFDDMNNNNELNKSGNHKKRFERDSLRDSLRKYAPEKLEKLTKIKSKHTENKNNSIETDRNSNLSDGASFLIQKMFSDNKLNQSASKMNQQIKVTNSTNNLSSSKSTPKKSFRNNSFKNDSSKTTDSSSSFRSPPTTLEMDSGVCVADEDHSSSYLKCDNEDALSETGTYTVELDNQDPIAEEARKRINEIFGVKETNYRLNKQQLDSLSNSSSNSSKPNSKQSFKVSSIKRVFDSNRTRHNSEKKQPNELQQSTERLSFRNRRSSLQSNLKRQDSFGKSSLSKLSVSKSVTTNKPNCNSSTKKSQLNQNINLINQNNTFVFNCATNNNKTGSNSLLNKARANSISKNQTKNRTTKLNGTYEETNSIRSEDVSSAGSTDLSSINSDQCKSDTGHSLRFNRAFALRRARLGIDTPPLTPKTSNKNSNKPNSHQSVSNHQAISQIPLINNQSRSSSQCSANEYFDRSDGGRYSLRVSSKPPISQSKVSNKVKNVETTNNLNNKHETSSLINAISASKNKVANKLIKNNQMNDHSKSAHVRANSFGNTANSPLNMTLNEQINTKSQTLNQLFKSRLSSAASNSSNNNTMSNASTSEDLSNISDQVNIKNLQQPSSQNLSPLQISRRIYSTKPHYIAQTNSFRNRLEENGTLYQNGIEHHRESPTAYLSNQQQTANDFSIDKKKFGQLSNGNNFSFNSNGNNKSLSALDYLVLSAVNELSFKLRCKLRSILDAEKSKYPINNENRILIEELLPQVNLTEYRNSETTSEKTISRDLSNVLKNLKRIEQSLEVINLLLESNSFMNKSEEDSTNENDLLCNKNALLRNDNFSLEI